MIAAVVLRLIECAVGALVQRLKSRAVLRIERHAHAAGQLHFLADAGAEELAEHPGLFLHKRAAARVFHEEDELVPADAADDIVITEGGPDLAGHLREHPVADHMSKGIVDLLEIVHVHNHEGVQGVRAALPQIASDDFFGAPLVVQSRQGIPLGLILERQLLLFVGVNVLQVGNSLEVSRLRIADHMRG